MEHAMNPRVDPSPFWSTSSFGDSTGTSPLELEALGEHLDRCRGARGRLFGLHCAAQSMHCFVAPRLVTTVVVVGLLVGAASLVV